MMMCIDGSVATLCRMPMHQWMNVSYVMTIHQRTKLSWKLMLSPLLDLSVSRLLPSNWVLCWD